jgi:CubicO group peptidase (beta-lactamase class C family)
MTATSARSVPYWYQAGIRRPVLAYGCAMYVDGMSGVAVVARSGIIVARRAGGLADRAVGSACTPETRFQIASVSKQFTAAAVLLLAGESRLSLDDPVSRWLGGCPRDWDAITIHHLLTHTAGLGHWGHFPALDQYHPVDPARQRAIFQREPLVFAPGSRHGYSSPGYVLLAWIVEQAGNQPYASFLSDRVFAPLGMRTASAGDPPAGTAVACGYYGGEPMPSYELATVNIGAGDIWCTAADLLRWDEAFGNDELLPASAREAMLASYASPGVQSDRDNWAFTGCGYGWMTGVIAGRRAFFHSGNNPGYLAVNAWLPDEQLTLAILTNDEATDVAQAVTDLLELAT